ncbi:MAG: hypothetical protein DRP45_04350 [Candidatus Zixiibacteriota bacterium]|nr:MAG: hypothetical protein DRP45_04350 [candidate division Zixibacteria bacterium]
MLYRLLADLVMLVHFAWIIFMLWGFVLTVRAFWRPAFFDRWVFRSVHLSGILLVAILELVGSYCPLTLWENSLRALYNPDVDYQGWFIVGLIERLIYPNVNPLVIIVPTVTIALFTMVVFVTRPPAKFRRKRD